MKQNFHMKIISQANLTSDHVQSDVHRWVMGQHTESKHISTLKQDQIVDPTTDPLKEGRIN